MPTEPPKADQPKRKRRWLHFSLRILLVLPRISRVLVALAIASEIILLIDQTAMASGEPPNPSPAALLRGVELARAAVDPMRAEIEIRYLDPPAERRDFDLLMEVDGPKRRYETFSRGGMEAEVVVHDGDVFQELWRTQHPDVAIHTATDGSGARGDNYAFDPRILGLSDLMSRGTTVRDCLWYDKSTTLELIGQETIRGARAWRVRATRPNPDRVFEYWVDEASFRVHRMTMKMIGLRSEINSDFDSPNVPSPFPSRMRTVREEDLKEGLTRSERTYVVKKLEFAAAISKERFTMASMDIPINTPVVDYRISKRIGYWDGGGLTEFPERPGLRADWTGPRNWIVAACAVLVCVLAWIFLWPRKSKA